MIILNFAENLKIYREKAGYSSAKGFASLLDIPYTTYTAYENQGREPKYELLVKIAKRLRISVDELLGNKKEDDPFSHAKKIVENAGFVVIEKTVDSDNTSWVNVGLSTIPSRLGYALYTKEDFIAIVKDIENSVKKNADKLLSDNIRLSFYPDLALKPENN